jgi:3-dehydroquinate dehydratase/shikimate dehydrogenase
MMARAAAALSSSSFIELRLDTLTAPNAARDQAPPAIAAFLADHSAAILLATCRRQENGGHFAGSVAREIAVLTAAAHAGAQMVDLEIESVEAAKKSELAALRAAGAALLISHHDFAATGDLEALLRRLQAHNPDFLKIVSTATTLTDNLAMLRLIEHAAETTPTVGICMGESGLPSRLLGLRAGAAFTFAAAPDGDPTGPGQLDAATLLDLYRLPALDAATKLYGVAGDPVRSSLSPLMLNTAFRRETLNAVYLPLQSSSLADVLTLARELRLHGLSITMPFKQQILPHLEKTDPLTSKIGACNTVLRAPDGKLYGFNTDVAGVVVPLEKRMPLKGTKILVLGAGGAARAAVFGLKEKAAEVFILNRTPETAQKLARQAAAKTIKREALPKTTFDIVVNATSQGMTGQTPGSPLAAHELHAKLVFDLVYNPLDTPLLQLARQNDIPTISGVEMFIQQGARQFELWTGKPAPHEEMLRVVLHALKQSRPPEPAA